MINPIIAKMQQYYCYDIDQRKPQFCQQGLSFLIYVRAFDPRQQIMLKVPHETIQKYINVPIDRVQYQSYVNSTDEISDDAHPLRYWKR